MDNATPGELRYTACTRQRSTYLMLLTFTAVAGTLLPTPNGWRVEKAKAQGAKTTGPRLLRDGPRPVGLEPTTSRSLVERANHYRLPCHSGVAEL